jgi:hypothetical protein
MRDHHKIQFRQVYAQRLHVVFKNRGIIPRVEQNSLSVVLHQSGKSPILRQFLRFPERIVEDRHFILCPAGNCRHTHQQKRQNPQSVDSQ